MNIQLISEKETYLIEDYLQKNTHKERLYVLNTLIKYPLTVPMMRNMLFQKQVFGFCTFDNERINNIVLFLYPSSFERTTFLQVLYLSLDDESFFKEIIVKLNEFLDDDIKKIKLILNDSKKTQIEIIEKIGFKKELSINLGKENRLHYFYNGLGG